MNSRFALLFTILSCLSNLSLGQVLDNSFEMPQMVRQADIHHAIATNDGKILLGGKIHFHGNTDVNHLIRLNGDGSLDETFVGDPEIGVVKAFQLLPTNEIIVGTSTHIYLMSTNGEVIKNLELEVGDRLEHLVYSDGYVWVGMIRNLSTYLIKRYDTDLVSDESFTSPYFTGFVYGMNVHQGKCIVSGFLLKKDDVSINPISRVNADGNLDETFLLDIEVPADYGSIDNLFFKKILIGSDNKILVQTNGFNGIIRLNADGSQDNGFSFDDTNFRHVTIDDVYLDDADNIYLVGYSNYYWDNDSYHRRILKYDYEGTLDTDFEISILTEKNEKTNPLIELDGSGNIFMANINNLANRYGLNKLAAGGTVDESFAPEVGTYGIIDVAEIEDEKFVIAGDFNRLGDFTTNDVAVLNLDGSVDESFQYTGTLERTPTDIGFYNGSIYLANETEVHKIQQDGTVDEMFNSQPAFLKDGYPVVWFASNIHIQDDGKIVTTSPNGIFRMTELGEVDNTYGPFYPSIGTTAFGSDMQKDGKVVFGGYFDDMNGAVFSDMVRIAPNGLFDGSFRVTRDATQSFGPGITGVTSLTNDETMVFGYFNRFSDFPTPKRMVKLDKNGQVDERFLSFLNTTFNTPAAGLKNYTSFRGGFVVAAFDQYFIIDDEVSFNYQLYAFNNSGIYQSKFNLPEGYKATQAIIPLVINNNDMILVSNFLREDGEPLQGIRLKINNLPKIIGHETDIMVSSQGFDFSHEHLEVDDADNVYPDDFDINIYEGDHFSISGNTIIPEAGYEGMIEVPVTVTEGSNESNFVLVTMRIEDDGSEIVAGIEDSALEIYPNPTSDIIEIISDQSLEIAIHDMSGNRVKIGRTNSKIDLSGLEDGTYIVKMTEADGTVYSSKVVKQ